MSNIPTPTIASKGQLNNLLLFSPKKNNNNNNNLLLLEVIKFNMV